MNDFLNSASRCEIKDSRGLNVLEWFSDRKEAHKFKLERIPFSCLKKWGFEEMTGNLVHESGKFFSIEGIHVKTNWGGVPEWTQPVINQPEIGFLGFITKKFDGILYFLIQAKMEPGNINMIQLAPTLQATRSNFMRVHHGRKPPYLEYFINRSNSRVLVDTLQSEQGARFLRKRNRNIIIEVQEDVPVYDDYCWMTLGQILEAMQSDNLINMDARTVLSCVNFGEMISGDDVAGMSAGESLLQSLSPSCYKENSNEEIISWFTEQKFKYDLDVERIPLREVQCWSKTDMDITHKDGKYFSVIACVVEADNREVFSWTQPLVKPHQQGLIAFVVKKIQGVSHFLVQAKVEPGNFDIVEMAPTVQCLTGSYEDAHSKKTPPFVDYVLSSRAENIRFDTLQSEEGGRFYREENRNLIVEADKSFPSDIPDNYIWMTAGQLKEFIKYNNFVNVQARCLLSSLKLN